MLFKSVLAAVFWTGVIFFSATGLLRSNNGDVVEPTALWAGIVAGIGAGMWGFLQTEFKRSDKGLRTDGLPSLLLLVVPLSAAIHLAAMALWPFVIDGSWTVVTELHSDPTAILQTALFLLGMMSCSITAMFGFARGGPLLGMLSAVLFLAMLGLGMWQGVVLFDNPVHPGRTVLWAVVAALGIAAMTVVATVTAKAEQESMDRVRRFRGEL